MLGTQKDLGVVSARPNDDGVSGPAAQLRILALTDLHSRLLSFDYDQDRPLPGTGLEALSECIAKARSEAPNVLLFDNGDTFQGNALGEVLAAEHAAASDRGRAAPSHPVVAALTALGVDAAVPGNHDFNFGLEFLHDLASQAGYPFILTNLVGRCGTTPAEDAALFPTTLLLERQLIDTAGRQQSVHIGLLGFVPPQVLRWDEARLQGAAETRDALQAARFWTADLRQRGADLVIALCHGGLGCPDPASGAEDVARGIARIAGIDAVIAGHRHDIHAEQAADGAAPIVAAGCHGTHLGQIDLTLTPRTGTGKGGWQVDDSFVTLRPAQDVPRGAASARIAPIAAPAHARVRALMAEPIGATDTALHSFFAGALPDTAAGLIARAQAEAVRVRLAGGPHADLPLLSAAPVFKTGAAAGGYAYTHIPEGPVSRRHLHDLYPFANTLAALRMTGRDVRYWLEHAARIYAGLPEGQRTGPLFGPRDQTHEFDIIHGLAFEIDISRPAGARIAHLRHADGRQLDPAAPVIVATSTYRAAGSGGYPVADIVLQTCDPVREEIERHIAKGATPTTDQRADWRITGPAGATLRFETSAEARPYLPGTQLQAEDVCPDGRLSLALTL